MSNINRRIASHHHALSIINHRGKELSNELERLNKLAKFHKEAIKNLEKKIPKKP